MSVKLSGRKGSTALLCISLALQHLLVLDSMCVQHSAFGYVPDYILHSALLTQVLHLEVYAPILNDIDLVNR